MQFFLARANIQQLQLLRQQFAKVHELEGIILREKTGSKAIHYVLKHSSFVLHAMDD